MAAGVISGAAALVLEKHPDWRPGEIKATFLSKARTVDGSLAPRVGSTNNASSPAPTTDDGLTPSYLLLSAVGMSDADFAGVRWRDAIFSGVRWSGLELNGVRWGSVDWTGVRWAGVTFEGVRWGGVGFDGVRWSGVRWGSVIE